MVTNVEHFRGINPETKRGIWESRKVQPGETLVLKNTLPQGDIEAHAVVISCAADDKSSQVGVTIMENIIADISLGKEISYRVKNPILIRPINTLTRGQSARVDFMKPGDYELKNLNITHE